MNIHELNEDKKKLEIAIHEINSLNSLIHSPGWRIIDRFLVSEKNNCDEILNDHNNKDLYDIQSARALKLFIGGLREMINSKLNVGINDAKEELGRVIRTISNLQKN
ncbi:MAG: hypothetical protein ACOWWR_18465 [Eubacteriales bacterium]